MTTERAEGDSFGAVLRSLRERAGLSQSAVARRAGLDPSFVNRLESGQRSAERSIAERLAAALDLEPADADRLLAAGGHLPSLFARVGLQDPTLQIVVRILGDENLPPNEREDFREIVRLIGQRWLRRGQIDQSTVVPRDDGGRRPAPGTPASSFSNLPDLAFLPDGDAQGPA